MSVHDLCCIGYITQDKIVTTKNTIYMTGYYLWIRRIGRKAKAAPNR